MLNGGGHTTRTGAKWNHNQVRRVLAGSSVLSPRQVVVCCLPPSMDSGESSAAFPRHMVKPVIEACSGIADMVLDPFAGSGTTSAVAAELERLCLGIELNPEYAETAQAAVAESWSKAG